MLRERADAVVTLAAQGVLVVEAVQAAQALLEHGVAARVVCVTSADLLFRAVRRRRGLDASDPLADEAILAELFDRPLPLVTVLDGHPHTLAFLGSMPDTPVTPLGVTAFGQVGTIAEVYDLHGIGVRAIVDAALDLVD